MVASRAGPVDGAGPQRSRSSTGSHNATRMDRTTDRSHGDDSRSNGQHEPAANQSLMRRHGFPFSWWSKLAALRTLNGSPETHGEMARRDCRAHHSHSV